MRLQFIQETPDRVRMHAQSDGHYSDVARNRVPTRTRLLSDNIGIDIVGKRRQTNSGKMPFIIRRSQPELPTSELQTVRSGAGRT